jgi:hypothetical protein
MAAAFCSLETKFKTFQSFEDGKICTNLSVIKWDKGAAEGGVRKFLSFDLGTKEVGLNSRVTKGINLPTDAGGDIKLLLYISVPECCLVNHVDIVSGSLVMHTISTIDELKLPPFHKLPHSVLHPWSLLSPPSLEKGLFHINELAVWVLLQCCHNGIQYILNCSNLNAVIGADEVLIYGLEPAHIVMGVTHQVHIQLPIHKRRTGVVESGSELQELRILLLSSSSSIKPPTTDDDPEKRLQQPQEADHIPPPPHHYPPTHHLCAPLLLFLLPPLLLQSFNPSSKTLLYTNQQREWIQPNSNNCLYFVSSLEAGGSNKHGRSILMEMGVYGMGD